jgi:dual specificity MAP kinase phosphatase
VKSSYDKIAAMEFSKITEDLFIGTTPSAKDYNLLRDLGVGLVINMRWDHRLRPDKHTKPLSLLWLRTIDSPFFPIPIHILQHGAQAALKAIYAGGKVYTHCAYGRHRGAAMGAAILIAQGMDPESAMDLIEERRSFADPRAFYIRPRILKFALQWTDNLLEINS